MEYKSMAFLDVGIGNRRNPSMRGSMEVIATMPYLLRQLYCSLEYISSVHIISFLTLKDQSKPRSLSFRILSGN
jgi:hypothetical protein